MALSPAIGHHPAASPVPVYAPTRETFVRLSLLQYKSFTIFAKTN